MKKKKKRRTVAAQGNDDGPSRPSLVFVIALILGLALLVWFFIAGTRSVKNEMGRAVSPDTLEEVS